MTRPFGRPLRTPPSTFTLLGLAGVALGLVALLTGLLFVAGQARSLSDALYARCLVRERYDTASQDARLAHRDWLAATIRQEAANPHIDADLRAQRVMIAQRELDRLTIDIQTGAPAGCEDLR